MLKHIDFNLILKVLIYSALAPLLGSLAALIYYFGYLSGFGLGVQKVVTEINNSVDKATVTSVEYVKDEPLPTFVSTTAPSQKRKVYTWGGPDLWEAVNKKRTEYGVNPLSQRSELCTIASIRLNELLDLGGLDNHEGFGNMKERRPDLVWIFEKYNVVAEFLVSGADSAEEAVSLWDNTLGHKKLLNGGEYVWGCTYAQNSIGVAITAY